MSFDRLRTNGVGGDFLERFRKLGAKVREIPFNPASAADQDMIGAGAGVIGKDVADERAEATLHAVADDRIANFLGDRVADPDGRVVVAAGADEEDEAGHGRALAAIGGKEVGALAKGD